MGESGRKGRKNEKKGKDREEREKRALLRARLQFANQPAKPLLRLRLARMSNDILFTSNGVAGAKPCPLPDKLPSPLIARASAPRHFAYARFTAQEPR